MTFTFSNISSYFTLSIMKMKNLLRLIGIIAFAFLFSACEEQDEIFTPQELGFANPSTKVARSNFNS